MSDEETEREMLLEKAREAREARRLAKERARKWKEFREQEEETIEDIAKEYKEEVDSVLADRNTLAGMIGRSGEPGRAAVVGGSAVNYDIERAWKAKTGKAAKYMWFVERLMNLAIHVFPFALLFTYIVALFQGWQTDAQVNSLALWIFPLVILILMIPLIAIASLPYSRLTKFILDPVAVGQFKGGEEKSHISIFGSIMGVWHILAAAVQFLLVVALIVIIVLWLIWAGYMNPTAANNPFFPFGAPRTQDLANCLCALAYMSLFWGIALIAHAIVTIVYFGWFVGYMATIAGNKNIKGVIAKVGLSLAMAKTARLKHMNGLSK